MALAAERRAPTEESGYTVNRGSVAKVWVVHGALWFGLIVYCWTAWVVSGDFTPNTIGRDLAPDWYTAMCIGVEIFAAIVTAAILWIFVIRTKLRTGSLAFDGLFFLSCWLLFFQEPWINWTSLQFIYTTSMINFGSWVDHIPGWSAPNGALMPVGLVYGTMYLWLVGIPSYYTSKFMTRMTARNPGIGIFKLLGVTFGALVVFDLVLETVIVRTGLFSYGATIPSLTLFAGTEHQFPLYETLSWCGTYLGLGCLHFFRDDRGRSLPERGIDSLRLGGRANTFARFLAIAGACQLVMLVTYNIPYQVYALHAGPIPKALQAKSWRMAGMCGPGTNYSCPAPGLPIARRSSPTNRITP
ncbi:MAG: hypothetical protein QOF76_2607 [Solirubrobacteraceae bacterium]|jgi:hypothetical protein|nr:hypothetical protein [Solirubrobacteraceae bacterium]